MATRKSNKRSYLSGLKRRSNGGTRRKTNTSRRRANGTRRNMRRKTARRAYMPKRRSNAAKALTDTKVLGMRLGTATSAAAAAGVGALASESVANFLDYQIVARLPSWARALGMAAAAIGVISGGVYLGNKLAPGRLKSAVPFAAGAMAAPLAIRTADAIMGMFRGGARPAAIAAQSGPTDAQLLPGEGSAAAAADTASGTIVETYGMSGSIQSGAILPMGRGRKRLLA